MPEPNYLEIVETVCRASRAEPIKRDDEELARVITRRVVDELVPYNFSLAPPTAMSRGATFDPGYVLAPDGRVFRCLLGIGTGNRPTWKFARLQAPAVNGDRLRLAASAGAGERLLLASEHSLMLERLERLEAHALEHRHALERLMRVTVERSSLLRQPIVVRFFGLRVTLHPVEDHRGQLRVRFGKAPEA
jgi:hypothetical protein